MENYSLKSCEVLIDKYVNECGGECVVLDEGVLGLGKIVLFNAIGKKAYIITEVYVNPWNSTHIVKKYNKLPKKYEIQIAESSY